jgi:phospholipid transport system substrate-binding protein
MQKAIALLVCVLMFSSMAQARPTPIEVVERFQDELLAVMKQAESLGYQGRYERLAPAVRDSHDLKAIAQIAVGPYWDELDEDQEMRLVDTFSRLSIATYAHRFDGYSGETFNIESGDSLSRDVVTVHSILIRPANEDIRFDYMLHQGAEGFEIVNIVVDGVSDLALKRAEYTQVLADQGFDALLAKLKDRISSYAEPAR